MKRLICLIAILLLIPFSVGCFGSDDEAENPEAVSTALPPPSAAAPQEAEDVTIQFAAPTAEPTKVPISTPEPTYTPAPTDTPEPLPLEGIVIGVDPGHQQKANREQEAVAPGSSTTKNKVSSGTRGLVSNIYEYEVNLEVGLILRELLEEAGATVIMTREVHDVDISNVERAELMNAYNVDLAVRLHCNGSDDREQKGAFMLVPKEERTSWFADVVRAAKCVIRHYCQQTGISMLAEKDEGLTYRGDQTGFNWCTRPIINIEMGHMTNREDEAKLIDPEMQKLMAKGIFLGILEYFTQQ